MSERLVMKFLLQLHKLPTCLGRKCVKEWVLSKIKQRKTWTSHQVTLLNEMNSVAGDALENQRRSLLNKATAELQQHQRQSHQHLHDNQNGVRRHLAEVQQDVQIQQVASGE